MDTAKKLHSDSVAAISSNHAMEIAKMQAEHALQLDKLRSGLVVDVKRTKARQPGGPNVAKIQNDNMNQTPDWTSILANFNYPIDSFIANLTGLDNEAVIIKLLEQVIAANCDYFPPLGCDDDIPKYLHSKEPIPKRKIEPSACLAMIIELYNQKREHQLRNAPVHVYYFKLD